MKVRTDLIFTFNNGNKITKLDGANFTLNAGDCAWSDESIALLTLATLNGDFLSLTFKYDEQNQSTVDAVFNFTHFIYLHGAPTPSEIDCKRDVITIHKFFRVNVTMLFLHN